MDTAPPPPLSLDLPARPESVGAARRAVSTLAADAGLDVGEIVLAVSEAVTNVVLHAYRDGEPGPITIEARYDPQERCLVVVVRDRGIGMSPRSDSPGLGLGLPTIARVAHQLEIDADDPGTRLSMRFRRDGHRGVWSQAPPSLF
jgi:serine/threonine-protein kinase RsbW/stage II sporulation protein AB (anti-sigma F factor)